MHAGKKRKITALRQPAGTHTLHSHSVAMEDLVSATRIFGSDEHTGTDPGALLSNLSGRAWTARGACGQAAAWRCSHAVALQCLHGFNSHF